MGDRVLASHIYAGDGEMSAEEWKTSIKCLAVYSISLMVEITIIK
jgi:hypothetical protein